MNSPGTATCLTRPRWDGSRMLFDIFVGNARFACAISQGALQDLSERRSFKTEDLRKSFMKARGRIEQIAHEKLRARPTRISGTLHIWADDLDDLPPSSAPVAAHASVEAFPRAYRLKGKRHGQRTETQQSGAEKTKGSENSDPDLSINFDAAQYCQAAHTEGPRSISGETTPGL